MLSWLALITELEQLSACEQGDQQWGECRQAEQKKKQEPDFSLKLVRKLGRSANDGGKFWDDSSFSLL